MRTLAIGDIHGCLKSLETLVDFIDLSKDDTLIILGDYIDRGPDSKGVIDYLLELQKTHNLILLKGNHECMIEEARVYYEDLMNWLLNGGIETLKSFEVIDFEDIDDKYWEFFKNCRKYHETENFIFVHAGLSPDLALEEQSEHSLYWLRFHKTKQHKSGKRIICGHTPQRPAKPAVKDHAICIDTGACNRGWLTCLDVDTGIYWQANEKGKTKRGKIKQLARKKK